MIKASEIMNTQVYSIKPDNTIKEAVDLLAGKKISGLPVVDKENKIIGILTEKDIVEFSSDLHIIPLISSTTWISPHTDISKISLSRKGFDMIYQEKVQNVMTKKVVTVTIVSSWDEIVKLMKNSKINHLPVLDDNKKLCGIITRTDLLNYLAEHRVLE
jgi:CBS domain-containing protein